MYKTHAEILEAVGVPALAEKTGLAQQHLRTMKSRNSIPTTYWPAIVEALKETHPKVTYDALVTAGTGGEPAQ